MGLNDRLGIGVDVADRRQSYYPTTPKVNTDDYFDDMPIIEGTHKAGVANFGCCDSGSCHNRKFVNAKARKGKNRK